MFKSRKPEIEKAFERMQWKEDRMVLDGIVFRIQYGKDDTTWDLGDQCVTLFKNQRMMDRYRAFFQRNPGINVDSMLELGIFEGGSIALWREILKPKSLSAVDLRAQIPTAYLDSYLSRTSASGKVHIHWQFDQADKERLHKVVREELGGQMDLVIDDASHMYAPSKASFEALFPLVRPGGVYIVEDWAWNHIADFQGKDHPWSNERSPSEFIFELLEGMGSATLGIERIEAFGPFVAVFRDANKLSDEFSLDRLIRRRPQHTYTWFSAQETIESVS